MVSHHIIKFLLIHDLYCCISCFPSDTIQFMLCANGRIHNGPKVIFVCWYITPFSSHCIVRVKALNLNLKMLVKYTMLGIFLRCYLLFHYLFWYIGLYAQGYLPIPLVMIKRICVSYYHHQQIGSMNHYLLFGVTAWVLTWLFFSNSGPRWAGFWYFLALTLMVKRSGHYRDTHIAL